MTFEFILTTPGGELVRVILSGSTVKRFLVALGGAETNPQAWIEALFALLDLRAE